jgi:RimJ/RimL family protein N-acetyltransferase
MIAFKALETGDEWLFLQERAKVLACQDSQGIVAFDNETGKILAVCVADSFTVDACQVHFAIDNPLVIRRGFLHEIARHLFHVNNRKRIFGLVPANNTKAMKLDTHIGFREVARIPDGYADGIDYVVLRMDRDTSPWLVNLKEAA